MHVRARRCLAAVLLALVGVSANAVHALQAQSPPLAPAAGAPYRNATLSPGERARDLLARMTLSEKFWQLFMIPGDLDDPTHDYRNGSFGLQISVPRDMRAESARSDTIDAGRVARAHAERINRIQRYFVEQTRLGIPIIAFEETLHGLGREGATTFPQAIGLAASWDTTLMARVASAIAVEARSRGIRQSLSPVVNIASDVRWGRVEETYGEDPYLASAMARAYVGTFERAGIVTTPKHLVANVGEGGRDSYPIELSQRALEERFFPPFRSAIQDAGARSVMSAYNSVDGSPATQNRALLTDVLRTGWGFTGFVISDAAATGGSTVLHHTEASTATAAQHALEAGLDVIFQSSYEQHRPYLDAFSRGLIAPAVIDSAVVRVLRVKFALGLFEAPYVNTDVAARESRSAAHLALARESAASSIVLLRNERQRLPLRTGIRRIAVIGNDATEARVGGYSAPGARAVSILDGIRARAGAHTVVRSAAGVPRLSKPYAVIPAKQLAPARGDSASTGVRGEYFDNIALTGPARITRRDAQIDFGWTLNAPARGIAFDWYSVRWTGTVTAPSTGARHIGVEGNDGYRLYIDDALVIDNWTKRSYGVRLAPVNFSAASRHQFRLEFFEATGNARVKLVWDAGVRDSSDAMIARAAALARQSDVAIVVAGLEEGEFRDRAMLSLPGRQEALIRAVAATGTPVVVALVGGSAITMSAWLDRVDAVVDVWYPGQQGGRAVADVLFGDVNPGARLPITFPMAEGQLPLYYNHKPTGRGDDYLDLTGQPLFPFGYGLSYTSFAYSDLRIEKVDGDAAIAARVHCTVRNSGARAGDEVAQLYLHDVLATVVRPMSELAGFARLRLAPGESRTIAFPIRRAQLELLNANMTRVLEPGTWRVMVGASSRDIRLRGEFAM